MRKSYVILLLLLAMIMVASTGPVLASINLLENPGFETGDFPPWEYDVFEPDGIAFAWIEGTNVHTGSYSLGLFAYEDYAKVWVWQSVGQCARSLSFWYVVNSMDDYDLEVDIIYLDGTTHSKGLPFVDEWTFVRIGLDTTKLVKEVKVELWVDGDDELVVIYIDDFELEACPVGGELISNNLSTIGSWLIVGITAMVLTTGVALKKKRPV